MIVLTNPIMPDVKPWFLTLRLKSLIKTNAATEYITIQIGHRDKIELQSN
jgi:hypothetical protein